MPRKGFLIGFQVQASQAQPFDNISVFFIGQIAQDTARYLFSTFVYMNSVIERNFRPYVYGTEGARYFLGYWLSYKADAQREKYPLVRHFT